MVHLLSSGIVDEESKSGRYIAGSRPMFGGRQPMIHGTVWLVCASLGFVGARRCRSCGRGFVLDDRRWGRGSRRCRSSHRLGRLSISLAVSRHSVSFASPSVIVSNHSVRRSNGGRCRSNHSDIRSDHSVCRSTTSGSLSFVSRPSVTSAGDRRNLVARRRRVPLPLRRKRARRIRTHATAHRESRLAWAPAARSSSFASRPSQRGGIFVRISSARGACRRARRRPSPCPRACTRRART